MHSTSSDIADRAASTLTTDVASLHVCFLANFGVALAPQRGYPRQLSAELRDTGVHIGLLSIGALIGDSKAEQLVDAHPGLMPASLELIRMSTHRPAPTTTSPSFFARPSNCESSWQTRSRPRSGPCGNVEN